MSMINCPDCGTEVSDRAPTCPKCGGPVAVRHEAAAAGAQLSTIQETSKKLKLQILISAVLFWGGLIVPFALGGRSSSTAMEFGSVLAMVLGFALYVGTKIRIWWHHK